MLERCNRNSSAADLVWALDRLQAYTAVLDAPETDLILDGSSFFGKAEPAATHPQLAAFLPKALFEAAAFLAGGHLTPESIRDAHRLSDHDLEAAALLAAGLPVDEPHRTALRAVAGMTKSEATPPVVTPPLPKNAVAVTPDGEQAAKDVNAALQAQKVKPVQLGGRHSAGTLLAEEPKTHANWLLKPGAGGNGPAVSISHSGASQSKREAAFYAVAKEWGLADYLPEAHLLLLDGAEYAALHFLPAAYESMAQLSVRDPGAPRRVLSLYRPEGLLHRWAVLDMVLGQVDRHAGNILAGPGGDVKLIDEGSSLAGAGFAPNTDPSSFIPYYLRVFAGSDFNALDPEGKLHALPRLSEGEAAKLGDWIRGLKGDTLAGILTTYGVDPWPSTHRLDALRMSLAGMPADLAVLAAWVLK